MAASFCPPWLCAAQRLPWLTGRGNEHGWSQCGAMACSLEICETCSRRYMRKPPITGIYADEKINYFFFRRRPGQHWRDLLRIALPIMFFSTQCNRMAPCVSKLWTFPIPGIACFQQIYNRNILSFRKWVTLDIIFRSIMPDMKIFFRCMRIAIFAPEMWKTGNPPQHIGHL